MSGVSQSRREAAKAQRGGHVSNGDQEKSEKTEKTETSGIKSADNRMSEPKIKYTSVTIKQLTIRFYSVIREAVKGKQYVITIPMSVVRQNDLQKFVDANAKVTLSIPVEDKGQ